MARDTTVLVIAVIATSKILKIRSE